MLANIPEYIYLIAKNKTERRNEKPVNSTKSLKVIAFR